MPPETRSKPEHEIFFLGQRQCSLMFAGNATKVREWYESGGYGVRAVSQGRVGFSYCTQEAEVGEAVAKAAAIAKHSPKTSFSFQGKSVAPKAECRDRRAAECDVAGLKAMVGQVRDEIERTGAQARVYASLGESEISITNSSGADASYQKTDVSLFAEAMHGTGYGYAHYSSCFLPKGGFAEFGQKAARMAREMERAKSLEKGKYVVVFSPEAFDSMLGVLLPSFSGDWKRRGTTVLAAKLGKTAFSEKLSIYDDPLARAAGARPFDDEGVQSRTVPLVEKGVLKNFLFDRETAALAREKEGAGGSCSRHGYDSRPGISASNIAVQGGDHSDFESEIRDFLLVESLHGTHTANTTTGDFGVEVNVAFRVRNGKREPHKGFMISGNAFALFNSVCAIEKRQETTGNVIAPRMAFSDVSVTS